MPNEPLFTEPVVVNLRGILPTSILNSGYINVNKELLDQPNETVSLLPIEITNEPIFVSTLLAACGVGRFLTVNVYVVSSFHVVDATSILATIV